MCDAVWKISSKEGSGPEAWRKPCIDTNWEVIEGLEPNIMSTNNLPDNARVLLRNWLASKEEHIIIVTSSVRYKPIPDSTSSSGGVSCPTCHF